MSYDFRANQLRLNRIISSGSIPILIYPSSSAADFAGNLASSFSTSNIGSDVFVYISGSSTAKTVFGGDALTSGSFRSLNGITGSVRYTDAASTPFIVGGPNITVNYNSLGQYELTSSGGSSFSLSGSTTVYGDGTNYGSGSISGLFDTTTSRVGKYEVDIVAIQQGNVNAAGWKYSTTTLYATSDTFRFIGINEITEDKSSGAVGWEVNFNDSGTLDVTGSTAVGGTFFYVRVVNKMVANFNSIIF